MQKIFESKQSIESRAISWKRVVGLGFFSILAACGNAKVAPSQTTSSRPPVGEIAPVPTFRFDALGGGSSIIQVYPGPGDTRKDRTGDGTFANGQIATIICGAEGRTVTSDPSVGERPRTTDDWFEITAGGQDFFATGTYGEVIEGPVKQC